MTDFKNEEILQELRRISKLMVLMATKGQTQKDKIAFLSTLAFTPKEIADLLGTTSNTVSVALAGIRKAEKARKGKMGKYPIEGTHNDEQGTS